MLGKEQKNAKRIRVENQVSVKQELQESIQQIVDDDLLVRECSDEYEWTLERSAALVSEFKRFIQIKKLLKDYDARICSPSYLIDQVWHMALTETFKNYYKKLCGRSLIGHRPEGNHYLRIKRLIVHI